MLLLGWWLLKPYDMIYLKMIILFVFIGKCGVFAYYLDHYKSRRWLVMPVIIMQTICFGVHVWAPLAAINGYFLTEVLPEIVQWLVR